MLRQTNSITITKKKIETTFNGLQTTMDSTTLQERSFGSVFRLDVLEGTVARTHNIG